MTSIVVIDSVKSNRKILEKIIETIDENIAVHSFESAVAALGWLSNQSPDLVITDYKTPPLNGLELAHRLRVKSQRTPILMITMAEDLALPLFAREAGITAFLRRPVDHQIVRNRIISLLAQQNKQRRLKLVIDNSPVPGRT